MAIHQFIAYLHRPGDGVADHAYGFEKIFRSWGYESRIYTLQIDEGAAGKLIDAYDPDPDDLLVYHYAGGSELTDIFLSYPGRKIVYYHNVTPPDLIRPFHAPMAARLAAGREEIRKLRSCKALVPSSYSQQELLSIGFSDTEVVPLMVDLERLHDSADSLAGQQVGESLREHDCIWLAVGRISPNKCCEDIIKAFAYYHHWINPRSHLVFVGGDKHFEAYAFNLHSLAVKLDLSSQISWTGWIDYHQGFGAYYKYASLFMHMSLHEGFGIPLIEAMEFGLPVLAYNATAVPYTLGESGVMVNEKRYDIIAELAHQLVYNKKLRLDIVNKQNQRLQAFDLLSIHHRLKQSLASFLPSV